METAKVDIRKLQLLNDRIAQTIDALNQVRLSVHGLAHTSAVGVPGLAPLGIAGFGYGMPGQPPIGYGAPPVGAIGPVPGLAPGLAPGLMPGVAWPAALGHTTFGEVDPFAASRYAVDPFFAARFAQTFPYAFAPYSPIVGLW